MSKDNTLRYTSAVIVVLLALGAMGAVHTPLAGTGKTMTGHNKQAAVATFAGGCFWCMEPPFDKIPGVLSTTSGYTGGMVKNPTYKEVCTGETGHAESLQIVYDPSRVSYATLLETFWRNIDPTTANRQFCDYGSQYRPAIFYHDDAQRKLAEASLHNLQQMKLFPDIAVKIEKASTFYPAEEYHQDFYKKNPEHYHRYRSGCGRDARLAKLWKNVTRRIVPRNLSVIQADEKAIPGAK